jgi:hypothetical protein
MKRRQQGTLELVPSPLEDAVKTRWMAKFGKLSLCVLLAFSVTSAMASSNPEVVNGGANKGDLFPTVGSSNFLGFEFGGKSYTQQLQEAVAATGKFSAVTVEIRELNVRYLWGLSCV